MRHSAIVTLPAAPQIHAQILLKFHVPTLPSNTTPHTNREKGSFAINVSVLFWYRLISMMARVPGRYLCFFGFGTGSPANCELEKFVGYAVRRQLKAEGHRLFVLHRVHLRVGR